MGVPRVDVVDAITRHWFLALMPLVAGVAVAVALGVSRQPVYTASTRMVVGPLTGPSSSFTSISDATQSLASAYSRAITAEGVVNPLAKQLGASPGKISGELSATPVPSSPVITLSATSPNSQRAVLLANLASNQLMSYINALNPSGHESGVLFAQFRAASDAYNRALLAQRRASKTFGNGQAKSPAAKNAIVAAETLVASTQLRRDALRSAYQNAQLNSGTPAVLQVLTPATSSSSDRQSKLELYVFIGAVAGILAGLALAVVRGTRVLRRHFLESLPVG